MIVSMSVTFRLASLALFSVTAALAQTVVNPAILKGLEWRSIGPARTLMVWADCPV